MNQKLKHEYLMAKRLAFLAAWHPRAGNPMLQKFVPKVIALLIARDYITLKTQCVVALRRTRVLLYSEEVLQTGIDLGEPLERPVSWTHYVPHYYEPRLYDSSLVLQPFKTCELKTPTLTIQCDAKRIGPRSQDRLTLILGVDPSRYPSHQVFFNMLNHIDTMSKSAIIAGNALDLENSQFYTMAQNWFRRSLRVSGYQASYNLMFTIAQSYVDHIIVIVGAQNISLRAAVDKGYLKRGTNVKAQIGNMTLWTMPRQTVTVKWRLLKLEIMRGQF